MEISYDAMFVNFIKLIIIGAAIIAGAIIFKRYKNRNIQNDMKPDNSIKDLEEDKKGNKITKVITIAINIIFCILLPIAIVIAMISPMTFDSPGSTYHLSNWIFLYASLSFPVVILGSAITSSILLFVSKSYKKALVVSLLPMLNIITVMFILFV